MTDRKARSTESIYNNPREEDILIEEKKLQIAWSIVQKSFDKGTFKKCEFTLIISAFQNIEEFSRKVPKNLFL